MTDTNNIQNDDRNANRLRKELQGLPKREAPWYFESQLQQRIHAERRESPLAGLFAKPLPAYALAIFLLAGGGVLLYNLTFDNSPLQESIEPVQTAETEMAGTGTETYRFVGPPAPPFAGSSETEASLQAPAGIRGDIVEPVDGRIREFALPVTSVGGTAPSPARRQVTLFDSMGLQPAIRDSLDSLGTRGDSTGRPE